MEHWDWQLVVALMAVALAVAVLVRRVVRWFRRPSRGCGSGCGSCPSNAALANGAQERPFVALDGLRPISAEQPQRE